MRSVFGRSLAPLLGDPGRESFVDRQVAAVLPESNRSTRFRSRLFGGQFLSSVNAGLGTYTFKKANTCHLQLTAPCSL